MRIDDIPDATEVFLDANVFVYAFTQHPTLGAPCRAFLNRIERREIAGVTSTHTISEMTHRVMTLEACEKFGWPIAAIAQRLKRHPSQVQQLIAYRQAVDDVLNSRIEIASVAPSILAEAAAISAQTGILSNDAVMVAIMKARGLTAIASQDADLDRVPEITRYALA